MTATYLILAVCTLLALGSFLVAENRDRIRAWVDRTPLDVDEADARAHGRGRR